jgi:sporulation protein YlmC with PRC-barrel domain
MKSIALTCAVLALATASAANAQQNPPPSSGSNASTEAMKSVPADSVTVTDYYKQSVYDQNDKKIGSILDVLVTKDGKITALVIGAGGFLGMGRHDVVVPFNAVKATKKDNKTYLTMNASKDALKQAQGFKYDRTATTWVPEDRSQSTEGSNRRERRQR